MLDETALFALVGKQYKRFVPGIAPETEKQECGTNTSAHAMRSQR
jgi:hypothetical protein